MKTVTVRYVNTALKVLCDIEIPVTEKTKKAQLGNGMGLALLVGARVRSGSEETA